MSGSAGRGGGRKPTRFPFRIESEDQGEERDELAAASAEGGADEELTQSDSESAPSEREGLLPMYPMFVKVGLHIELSYLMASPANNNLLNVEIKEISNDGDSGRDDDYPSSTSSSEGGATKKSNFNKRQSFTSYSGSSASSSGLPATVVRSLAHSKTLPAVVTSAVKQRWDNNDLLMSVLKYVDDSVVRHTGLDTSDANSTVSSRRTSSTAFGDDFFRNPKKKRESKTEAPPDQDLYPGCHVYAKFLDNRYYYGTLLRQSRRSSWMVQYHDGATSACSARNIILENPRDLIGHNVFFISLTRNETMVGLIMSHERLKMYAIASNMGDYFVPPKNMFFSETHAREILRAVSFRENALKRREFVKPRTPSGSGVARTRRPAPERTFFSSSSTDIEDELCPRPTPIGVISGCRKEVLFNPSSKVGKLKTPAGKMPSSDVDDNTAGPIKIGGWFIGMNFIITSDDSIISENPSTDSDDYSTDDENYHFTSLPYVYDRLQNQIENAGGRVFQSIAEIPVNDYHRTLIVAPKPCLTRKYIEGMACNIHFVSHEWVINCTKEARKLDVVTLPVGYSIELNRFINRHERCNAQPFRGKDIDVLHKGDERFANFWIKILRTAGATADLYGLKREGEIILTEDRPASENFSVSKKKIVVSPIWVIQCLINGRYIDPTSNKIYEGIINRY